MPLAERALVALPLLAIAGVVAVGWWSIGRLGQGASDLARNRVVPLVEREFPQMAAETAAQRNLLEADRDVHQALIAEKLALSAEEDALPALAKDNAENIGQARERIGKALDQLGMRDTAEGRDLLASLAKWEAATAGVIVKAGDPT
jgi:hypothetical protein